MLGAPRIERDGVPVEVDTRKAIALAAYLAVTRRGHTRDALAGLLWPEYSQGRARAALRRTLSSLGKARAEGWLLADRENVDLEHGAILVDVVRFEDLLAECKTHGHPEAEVCPECLPLLTEAEELYRDDFMAGFGLRDSVAFDDWQFFQSESLRRELAGALERLARGRGALGEWEAAVAHARRWLALDVLHEPAHRLLMALYAYSDERAAALRQYRECVRVLDQELGVAPLEETTLLYRAIQENDLPPKPVLSEPGVPREPRAAPVETTNAAPPDNPLVGRDLEWEALLGSYGSVGEGGRVVVVEGEAGIGKTRLAEEFLAHARERGATVVTARCYAGEKNLAYGPLVEGLSAALGRDGGLDHLQGLPAGSLQEAARLLPDLSPEPSSPAPPLDTPGARSRFLGEVVRVLLAMLDGPPPGVLFLDDLHWADDASLGLLNYLIRRLDDKPLYVLLTWRAEEVPEGHRLRDLLAEARRSGVATTLTLDRLDPASVEELVGHTVAEAGMLGPRLSDETEGLPLFLTEYLAAIEKGELEVENDTWTLPGGVQDLLRTRLATVGETAGQVLAAAAVVGRSFDFDTVRAASGRGEEETLTALEEPDLARPDPGGRRRGGRDPILRLRPRQAADPGLRGDQPGPQASPAPPHRRRARGAGPRPRSGPPRRPGSPPLQARGAGRRGGAVLPAGRGLRAGPARQQRSAGPLRGGARARVPRRRHAARGHRGPHGPAPASTARRSPATRPRPPRRTPEPWP